MAPIRRYLRITKYSVLEVRIYLENPALAETWLLRSKDPALARIIQAVRPLVLPKLREENERARGKSKSKKGVKDIVVQDDFEVSIFLTELSSRHSLLTKQKSFREKPRMRSNTGKLTSWLGAGTADQPITVSTAGGSTAIREDEDDGPVNLEDIPDVNSALSSDQKERGESQPDLSDDQIPGVNDVGMQEDEKKRLALNTSYDGFSIYGRILCLVVKRRGRQVSGSGDTGKSSSSGQQMLENWVSTQAAQEQGGDDQNDDG